MAIISKMLLAKGFEPMQFSRKIRDRSANSSVVTNESCFKRDLGMTNHLPSYRNERIASLSSRSAPHPPLSETKRGLHNEHCSGQPSKNTSETAPFTEAKMEGYEIMSAELHLSVIKAWVRK